MSNSGATTEEVIAFASWSGKDTGTRFYLQRARQFLTLLQQAGFRGDAGKSHVLGRSRFPAEWFQAEPWLQVNQSLLGCILCIVFQAIEH